MSSESAARIFNQAFLAALREQTSQKAASVHPGASHAHTGHLLALSHAPRLPYRQARQGPGSRVTFQWGHGTRKKRRNTQAVSAMSIMPRSEMED